MGTLPVYSRPTLLRGEYLTVSATALIAKCKGILYPVYTIQPVVKPVEQAVGQPVVSCIQTSNRLKNQFYNRFDNQLYCVNGVGLLETAAESSIPSWASQSTRRYRTPPVKHPNCANEVGYFEISIF